jgi:hypothetical protein
MSSGQDITAGRKTGAESTTELLADTTDDNPPVDFQGDYVFVVGAAMGDRRPSDKALTGLFSYGHGIGGGGIVGSAAGAGRGGLGGVGIAGFGGDGGTADEVSLTAGIGVFGQGGSGGEATGTGPGVFGLAGGVSDGVIGVTRASGQSGVAGINQGSDGGVGVFGTGRWSGIVGRSQKGSGLIATTVDGVAVDAISISNYGVVGVSKGNIGVYGFSLRYHGVVGDARPASEGSAAAGVLGMTTHTRAVSGIIDGTKVPASSTAVAIYGEASVDSDFNYVGHAGFFFGPVNVDGDLVVFGGKSAAVPHPDGSHRTLYALESPDSWFEDFGHGTLAGGRAHIKLDPDFMTLVHAGHYHVFLTPYGECNALFVTGRTHEGFDVNESQSGQSSVGFSYRVVAKRKDIVAERLAAVRRRTRTSAPHFLPARHSAESLSSKFNLSEQQLAQLSAGADIPVPPKPAVPNLVELPRQE